MPPPGRPGERGVGGAWQPADSGGQRGDVGSAQRQVDRGTERKMAQLPVRSSAPEELTTAAERSKVVTQFRALAEWLGPQGRELTAAKNIRPADARDLITLLGTGDEGLRFRSATELPGLSLAVTWAQQARIHPAAGHSPAPGHEGPSAARRGRGPVAARVRGRFRHRRRGLPSHMGRRAALPGAADIRRGCAGCPCLDLQHGRAGPSPRLAESVWQGVEARFDLGHVSSFTLEGLRARTNRDVEHIFDAFEALCMVTPVRAMASEMFLQDLSDPPHRRLTAPGRQHCASS
jgi:hypothetical protein